AVLEHPDLPIALDNLRFDLADLFMHEVAPIFLAGDNLVARFLDAARAERIRLARPAQGGLGLFPGLQERLIRPLRRYGRIWIAFVEVLNRIERHAGCFAYRPVNRSQNLRAYGVRHKPLTLSFPEWCCGLSYPITQC